MNFFIRSLLLLSLACLPAVQAADSGWLRDAQNNHADVRLRSAPQGSTTQLLLDIRLESGWKTYWRTPGEGGVAPTIHWQQSGIQSEWHWPTPARFNVSGITTQGYHDRVALPLRLHNVQGDRLAGTLTLSTCSDVCILTDYPFSLDLSQPGDAEFAADYSRAMAQVPVAAGLTDSLSASYVNGELQIRAQRQAGWQHPQLFFDHPSGTIIGKPTLNISGNLLEARAPVTDEWGESTPALAGETLSLVLADSGMAQQSETRLGSQALFSSQGQSFLFITLMALLGGFILNLMPCVLPVLAIKLSGLVQQPAQTRRQTRQQFLASGAGIITSFLFLALLMSALRLSGQALGWGIQFQSPVFLLLMVLVTFLFSASLFDLLHFRLPSSFNTRLATQGSKGLSGHFTQGAFATLLATPCSAPFLGTALAYALTAPLPQLWLLFLCLGIGMSLPWLLVAALPGIARCLPRPGRWMVHLRTLLALMMLVACFWLLSLLVAHWGHTVVMLVAGAMVVLMSGWLIKHGAWRQATAVFFTVTLTAAWLLITRVPSGVDALNWQPLSEDAISVAQASHKRIFIDVTADWCITCKINKSRVLASADVRNALAAEDVVLLRGDWTHADPILTQFLQRRGSVAVPFNQIYGPAMPQGQILSPLLSRDAVLSALSRAKEKQ
ncbi:protein-disulfide reductase DsbD family protein [Pantoea sp. LMR881]|uniref:protein-disulfide reductase DsbD family protein n=1 Tax=Pantoea sp. LMR881 TaxID=3014336 RepID=UPI0022AE8C62|nr:protein-disulfide reductase DsbD domain-containing protein [Pantoea sp. LMR881]MCZ4058369.1 protein-disulfide reductase DsbD family protein [Pantoea sp. LMR881]